MACPRETIGGWEFAVIRHGRLAGAATSPPRQHPQATTTAAVAAADRQAFEAWLRQDPRHRRAAAELSAVWGALDGLSDVYPAVFLKGRPPVLLWTQYIRSFDASVSFSVITRDLIFS